MNPNSSRGRRAPDVAITPGTARRRIHPTFADTLTRDLGRRDWVKGERATINELLVSLRSQATAEGFPSNPKRSDAELRGDAPDATQEERDAAALHRALREARLDGVWGLLETRPELLQPGEVDLLPRLLFEAAVHGLRPHAGHERAIPSHLAIIQRERAARGEPTPQIAAPSVPVTSAENLKDAHARIDALHARIDDMGAQMGAQLGQILAMVSPPTTK